MVLPHRKWGIMRVLVVYYSLYGHVYQLAKAAGEGANDIPGVEADLRRVPETLPGEVLENIGALDAQSNMQHIPICDVEELADADAILFGTPTRFGNMCGQMRQFLDATGGLWQRKALVGKVGSVFTSSGSQHGGQESTILSFHLTLLHHGMIVVGLPYVFMGQTKIDSVVGCSPYGASTIAGPDGSRQPTEDELAGARFQGQWVADIARKLKGE
jgi:NAD(P)H dehydrogenase (quinone)